MLVILLWIVIVFAESVRAVHPRGSVYYERSLTPFGQVRETIPPEVIERSDPIAKPSLVQLATADQHNDRFTPRFEFPDSRLESTPHGFITLGDIISREYNRIVFSIQNNTDYTIVYQHDCLPGGGWSALVHPLLSRVAYSNAASAFTAESIVSWISPPAPMRKTWKTQFDMKPEEFDLCFFSRATVRYALVAIRHPTHRIISLDDAFRQIHRTNKLYKLFYVGVRLMRTIKQLHLSKHIAHGNIMPSNMLVYYTGETTSEFEFRLDDFSRAAWLNITSGNCDGRNVGFRDLGNIPELIWMSPWELANGWSHVYSSRDDVFRLIEVIAESIRTTPDRRPEMLADGTLFKSKAYSPLFDFGFFLSKAPATIHATIQSHLSQIDHLVRLELATPPYDELEYHLYSIGKALSISSQLD
jgi:hypothetical protein